MDRVASIDRFSEMLEALTDNLKVEKRKDHELEELKHHLRRYVDVKEALSVIPDRLWALCTAHCAMYTSDQGNVFTFKMRIVGDPEDQFIWEINTPLATIPEPTVIEKQFHLWDNNAFLQRHF